MLRYHQQFTMLCQKLMALHSAHGGNRLPLWAELTRWSRRAPCPPTKHKADDSSDWKSSCQGHDW